MVSHSDMATNIFEAKILGKGETKISRPLSSIIRRDVRNRDVAKFVQVGGSFLPPLPFPLATGEAMRKWAHAAPVPCPIRVTFWGSPPNCSIFSFTQFRAATWSNRAKFFTDRFCPPGSKKPVGNIIGQERYEGKSNVWLTKSSQTIVKSDHNHISVSCQSCAIVHITGAKSKRFPMNENKNWNQSPAVFWRKVESCVVIFFVVLFWWHAFYWVCRHSSSGGKNIAKAQARPDERYYRTLIKKLCQLLIKL